MKLRWLFLLFLLIIGALAAAAFMYLRPSAVVSRAMENTAALNHGKFTARLGLDNTSAAQQLLGETATLEFLADGSFNRSPEKRSSLQSQLAVTAKTDTISMRMTGEARLVGENAYVNLAQVPAALTALTPIKGYWIALERGEAAEDAAAATSEEEVLSSITYQGRESVDGESVIVYSAVAAPESAVRLFDQIASVLGTKLTADQADRLRENLASMQEVPVKLWINPWQSRLRRLAANANAPNGNTIAFDVKLQPLQKAPEIAAPENPVTWQQLLSAVSAETP